jgi:ABC-type branched-subunit amino acid transport system substrate-binding protein
MKHFAKNSVQTVQERTVIDGVNPALSVNVMGVMKFLARSLVKWVVTPAGGAILAFVIGARVTSFFAGPDYYKVYVVGKLGSDDELEKLFKAIPEGPVPNLTIDTKPVMIEKRDDKGDAHQAEQIAQEIAGKKDTLMIVGHALSTQTKVALPYYLGGAPKGAEPPIPVILTTETNPELLPSQVPDGSCPPALRLSPTDNMQAAKAASFVVSSRANNFWVVADTNNSIYSQYLTRQFISQLNGPNKRVVLSSTNQAMPSFDVLKALKIDGVFFAGGWADALILIRQVRALTAAGAFPSATGGPMVLLSDGAVDQALLQQGEKDVNDVFLTHPMTAKEYTDGGYTQYGGDAYNLVRLWIKEADKEFIERRRQQSWFLYWVKLALKMHRVTDARAVLDEVVQEYVTDPNGPNSQTDCKYQRKANGKESTSGFHVWRIQDSKFADVE